MQGQDYIFVRAFVPFIASLLVKAWKEGDDEANVDIILSGIATLNDEVSWFKREASKWGVSLDSIVPQQANLVYCRYCIISHIIVIESFLFLHSFWKNDSNK